MTGGYMYKKVTDGGIYAVIKTGSIIAMNKEGSQNGYEYENDLVLYLSTELPGKQFEFTTLTRVACILQTSPCYDGKMNHNKEVFL